MEKRIALLKDNVVFNIIVGPSAQEMAVLFDCQAIEVTDETLQAHFGYGFVDGVFEQPPPQPVIIPPIEQEILSAQEETIIVEETPTIIDENL
jgi:hypothetical protein